MKVREGNKQPVAIKFWELRLGTPFTFDSPALNVVYIKIAGVKGTAANSIALEEGVSDARFTFFDGETPVYPLDLNITWTKRQE